MSSFIRRTKHPVTGQWKDAQWIDDYFGHHRYGVLFPNDEGKAFDPEKVKLETEESTPVPAREEKPVYDGHMTWCDVFKDEPPFKCTCKNPPSEKQEINFLQHGDFHCFYCHLNTPPSLSHSCTGTDRTPCTKKCGKWFRQEADSVDEFVRDVCSVVPKSESEVKERLEGLLSQTRKEATEEAEKKAYLSPCSGCPEGHPSFWKTIVESEEWKKWEKEQSCRLQTENKEGCFDYDESRECGWFSPEHFAAFLEFCNKEALESERKRIWEAVEKIDLSSMTYGAFRRKVLSLLSTPSSETNRLLSTPTKPK